MNLMDTTVDELAEELVRGAPGDIRVVLREHDVYAEDLSASNAWDVRVALDPGGERSRAQQRAGTMVRAR